MRDSPALCPHGMGTQTVGPARPKGQLLRLLALAKASAPQAPQPSRIVSRGVGAAEAVGDADGDGAEGRVR